MVICKLRQRRALRVEVIQAHVAIRLNHDGNAALRLRPDPVGESLFDDESEIVIRIGLGKQIAHERGLARAGHSKQNGELRGARKKIADANQVVIRAVVKRFRPVEVPREGGGQGKQVGEPFVQAVIRVMIVGPPDPARPCLEPDILRRGR